ncbi:MAG: hypothetical protein IT557_17120 [Alphaproteobacteria bacterium]|nr:hypothetical protein [Alphaproteobacteria bacterium]
MPDYSNLDAQVRRQLRKWPQHPQGLWHRPGHRGVWLRGRPGDNPEIAQPFLKYPGSNHLKTLPDGLWLMFSGDATEPFVDILAIEACWNYANFLDKRSRFAASTQSMLAVCPATWLRAVPPGEAVPRWRQIGVAQREPDGPLVLPVRDVRVLYALRDKHYRTFAEVLVPHAHEFFCPVDQLIADNGFRDQGMTDLMSRITVAANFLRLP